MKLVRGLRRLFWFLVNPLEDLTLDLQPAPTTMPFTDTSPWRPTLDGRSLTERELVVAAEVVRASRTHGQDRIWVEVVVTENSRLREKVTTLTGERDAAREARDAAERESNLLRERLEAVRSAAPYLRNPDPSLTLVPFQGAVSLALDGQATTREEDLAAARAIRVLREGRESREAILADRGALRRDLATARRELGETLGRLAAVEETLARERRAGRLDVPSPRPTLTDQALRVAPAPPQDRATLGGAAAEYGFGLARRSATMSHDLTLDGTTLTDQALRVAAAAARAAR